jgi:hypothetical protein
MRLNALALPSIALLALLGCNSVPQDGSKVLANVGGEKITEGDFRQVLESSGAPKEQIADFLANPAARDQRAGYLNQLAMGKALIAYAKTEGLDQDPKVKQAVEQAMAKAYFQALVERRVGKGEPSEAQLKAYYEKKVAERTALGQAQGLPKYEEIKAQLPQLWKQEQMQEAQAGIMGELKEKVSMTIADEWKVVGQ